MQPQEENNNLHKRRTIIYIRKEDINHNRAVANVKTRKGTRKLHSVRTVRSEVVLTRRLPCFCQSCQHFKYDECENSAYVDKWKEANLHHVPRVQRKRQQNIPQQGNQVTFSPVVLKPSIGHFPHNSSFQYRQQNTEATR